MNPRIESTTQRPTRRTHTASTAAVLALTLSAFLAGLLAGCAKPLLSRTEERTPFDRYDGVRGQVAPQVVEDEFGRFKPNVRGRLMPKE